MGRKLIHLICLVLVLGPAGATLADLVAHWPLDEGAGGITPDMSGNGLDGTLVGGPTFVAGMLGQAIQLDGSNTMYVDCGTDPAFDITEQLTVAAWIKMDHVDDRQPIINKEGDGVRGVGYRVESGGTVHVQLYKTGGAVKTDLNSTINLEADRWYHVAYTYQFVADGTSITRLYVDGEEHISTSSTVGPLEINTNILEIGRYVWSASYQKFFNGSIDEVVIFDHVLSADDVESLLTGLGSFPKARNPSPEDGALYEDTWVNLSWSAGDFAVSHNVYMGDNFADVNAGTGGTFLANVPENNMMDPYLTVGIIGYPFPEGLVPGTTYYWRVDEVNDMDPNSPWKGNVWSFSIPSKKAIDPVPADGARFVDTDVTLAWTPGFGAITHTVYFGDDFDTVNNATGAAGLPFTTYTPGPLEPDKTYYWRVDENDDMLATHTGDVWSFKTLPDIPIADPSLVGWWKLDQGSGTTALDWSGHDHHGTLKGGVSWAGEGSPVNGDALSFDGYSDGVSHTTDPGTINWVSVDPFDVVGPGITLAAWIRPEGFDIGDARIITKQKTWSSSDIWWMLSTYEDGTALRMRLKTDDGGPDNGTTTMWSEAGHLEAGVWSHVAATYDGSEMRLYHNGVEIISTNKTGTIPADPTAAVAIGNGPLGDPGGLRATFHGLIDDVRVYNKGVTAAEIPDIMRGDTSLAWGPSPSNGATVSIDQATPLSWSPGDKAAQHDVYFGTDRDAVADADTSTAEVYRDRQSVTSYTPPEGVEWGGGPYYWRIDEYNTDATISKGGVWSFTVADFILVDDIEDYDVDNPIWENWRDGLGFITVGGVTHAGNGSGSEVGDPGTPSYTEEGIVHGGRQSMPYWYNNSKPDKMKYSEAKLTLSAPRDWTEVNVKALSLWFRGHPDSVGSFVESPPGTYTMTASGYDIWRTADGVETDEFHFAYKTLSGPGTITAKVESVQNTNGWAKAGVMIRETLDPDSAHAFACITPSNGVASQGRPSAGGTSVSTNQTGITAPHWVKLERDISGQFTISHSANGSTWEPVQNASTLNIPMRANVYIGLALTAHNAAATCEAVFSSVTITDTVGPQWMHQDIGIQNNDLEPMYVAVANSTGQPAVVYHDDPNAAQIDTWTEWNIDLKEFQDKGINLTDVDSIALGFGNRDNPQVGGAGKMYFDDIRLYRPRCMPELVKPAADLSNNCVVDYADLEILASAWLGTGHLVSPQQPSEAGLVAHWPLQDGLNDITGNGHDGTAMNGASIVGGALVLDGNQQYVEVAHDPALNLSQAFTIAAFVSLDDTGDRRPIVTKEHTPDASRGWNCWIQDGEPRMQLMDGVKWATTGDVGQSKLTVTSGTTLDPETRYHLAFVYDSTGPEQIYVDGLLQLSEDVVTGTLHVNEQPVQIGAYIWDLAGYHRYLDGSIEDLRIYSRALSEAEIVSLAGEIAPISEPFDLNVDGVIDFKDFAVLADAWLYEQLWPEW